MIHIHIIDRKGNIREQAGNVRLPVFVEKNDKTY